MIEFFGRFLKKADIFSLNFSKKCIQDLSIKMKERTYVPGEIIYKIGNNDNNLYFVHKG